MRENTDNNTEYGHFLRSDFTRRRLSWRFLAKILKAKTLTILEKYITFTLKLTIEKLQKVVKYVQS